MEQVLEQVLKRKREEAVSLVSSMIMSGDLYSALSMMLSRLDVFTPDQIVRVEMALLSDNKMQALVEVNNS